MAKRKKRPIVPGSPLTYGDVARERDAELKLRYGPAENALRQRQENTTNWFDRYKADIAAKGAAQAARYQDAITSQQQIAQQSQQMAGAQSAQADAAMAADAAKRGATYSGRAGAQSAAGTDIRKGLADLVSGYLAGAGAAQSSYTAEQGAVGSAAQLSELLKGQKAREELVREKGAYGQEFMAKRRDEERRSVLENLAFGLKVDEARADDRKEASKTNRWGYTNAEWTRMSPAEREAIMKTQRSYGKGPRKPAVDPAKEAARIKDVREKSQQALGRVEDARSRWDTLASMTNPKKKIVTDESGKQSEVVEMKDGKPVMIKPTPTQIRAQLQKEGFKADEIHLALMIRAGKKFAKKDIEAAHRLGIRVPRHLLPGKSKGVQGANDARPADPKYGRG